MPQAKIQSRGRVTVPVEVRQALGLQPGDEVHFVEVRPGRFELRAEVRAAALLAGRRRSSLRVEAGLRGVDQLKLPL